MWLNVEDREKYVDFDLEYVVFNFYLILFGKGDFNLF